MEFFKILWRLLKPFKRQLVIYLILIVIYELLQLVDSYIISLVIGLIGQGFNLKLFVIFLVAVLVFDELFGQIDRRTDWQIVVRLWDPIYRHFKKEMLEKFMAMEMRWHYQQRSGTLMGKVQDGTSKILDMVMRLGWEFIPTIVQAIISLVPLIWLSWPVTTTILVALLIFMLLSFRQQQAQAPLWKKRHDGYEDEWGVAQEMVSNVETVVLYNQQERLLQGYGQLLDLIIDASREEAKIWIHRYGQWRLRIYSLARRAALALLVIQVFQGELTIASMIFLWTITERLFHAFWRFSRLYNEAARSLEALKRLEGVVELKPSIVSPKRPKAVPKGSVTIEFQDVFFSYNADDMSIGGLNLIIRGGETVGIVGPSGAGKTTLRRLLTRSWDINQGKILINGVDVCDLSLRALRGVVAYVPQGDEVAILNESFAYNIAFGRPNALREEVVEAAESAGIHEFILNCENGYETLLGEKGLRLSGGQKQRVALARAILADRPILILDEATSSVDSVTEDEIQERLVPIFKDRQRTVLIIAHRLSTLWGVADRILVFDQGKLVEEGTHDELLDLKGLYAELVARQLGREVP